MTGIGPLEENDADADPNEDEDPGEKPLVMVSDDKDDGCCC